nr:ParB N-terminal domain-containing protein [Prauserella rugosa]
MPLDLLVGSPANRRDETQDDADELVDAIRAQGVLQPLGIVTVETFCETWPEHAAEVQASEARHVVVNGNRRLWAAREAGLATVPVHQVRTADLRVAVLSENVNRRAMSPLAEADAVAELVELHGGQVAAAKALGRSQGWISGRVKLRKQVAPELQQKVEAGELAIDDALKLAKKGKSHADQVADYQALISGGGQPEVNEDGAVDLSGPDKSTAGNGRSKRSQSAQLHPGLPKAAANAAKAVRELVLAVGDARRDGTSEDELRAILKGVADGLGVDVDGLPPAVLAAAKLDGSQASSGSH